MAVEQTLGQIWTLFNQAGIAEDLAIVEHLARLLTEEEWQAIVYSDEEKYPQPPPDQFTRTDDVKRLLESAVNEVGSKARLLDRHILFHFDRMQAGKRYPTPRHLTHWLSELADPQPGESIADFSCGTGGFLIAQPDSLKANPRRGFEIAPEWARLARTNLLLHIPPFDNADDKYRPDWGVNAGNVLQYFQPENRADKTYDVILTNPPFGLTVDRDQAEVLTDLVSTISETVITALIARHLSEKGRAAILVPAGLLFKSGTEQVLRKRLVEESGLEAVIGLPKDSLQPFSGLQTYVVLLNRARQSDEVWFWRLNRDGYPTGRGRNLAQETKADQSDLPFALAALLVARQETEPKWYPSADGAALLGLIKLDGGILLSRPPQTQATKLEGLVVEWLPKVVDKEKKEQPAAFLVEVNLGTGQPRQLLRIVPGEDTIKPTEGNYTERAEYKREVYGIQTPKGGNEREEKEARRGLLYDGTGAFVRLALRSGSDSEPAWLGGLSRQRATVEGKNYDLRPEEYIRPPEALSISKKPAELMADIRRGQDKLARQVDSLLSRLEGQPLGGEALPSAVLEAAPFGALSTDQKNIWQQVRGKQTTVTSDAGQSYKTAYPFSQADLETTDGVEAGPIYQPREPLPDSDQTELPPQINSVPGTLELLEKMGLIVPVVLSDSNGQQYEFYRRTTRRDLWKVASSPAEAEVEAEEETTQ